MEHLKGIKLKNKVGTKERIREAFEVGQSLAGAAYLLKCSTSTVYKRVKEDPTIREGLPKGIPGPRKGFRKAI